MLCVLFGNLFLARSFKFVTHRGMNDLKSLQLHCYEIDKVGDEAVEAHHEAVVFHDQKRWYMYGSLPVEVFTKLLIETAT